jgi:signal recognition particle subunit SRP54
MGDVLSLIEEIGQKVDHKKAEKAAKKMAKGQFDLEDMRDQLLQMEQMGGIEALMDKMPGMGQIPQSCFFKTILTQNFKKGTCYHHP